MTTRNNTKLSQAQIDASEREPAGVDESMDAPHLNENPGVGQVDLNAEHEGGGEPELQPFEDPRARIAQKQRERREQQEREHLYDERDIPLEVQAQLPPDEGGGGRKQNDGISQGAAQKAAPSDSGVGLTLKVNGNEFTVSREDALRHAGIEPDEAGLFTDVQITRLAQKHIAANQFLEEAKAARNSARAASVADGSQPGDDNDANNGAHEDPEEAHQSRRLKVIESIQLDAPEDAAKNLDEYIRDTVQSTLHGRTKAERAQTLRAEIGESIASVEAAYPEIAGNRYASVAAIEEMYDIVGDELVNTGHVTPQQVAALRKNNLLADAFVAASTDGLISRKPADIINAAVERVRNDMGIQTRQPQPARGQQQQPGSHDRIEAKRGLIQQPQRGSAVIPQSEQRANLSPEDSRKAAILKRKAHQSSLLR